MGKYDRELTELRETYENQVLLCKKEMQNELDRLSEHYHQLSSDEQTRAQTKLQSKEQVRFDELFPFIFVKNLFFRNFVNNSNWKRANC